MTADSYQNLRAINDLYNESPETTGKKDFLRRYGWKEVPSNVEGKTCWQAPVKFITTPLYYALDAAYALERSGPGVWAVAGEIALGEALQAEDIRKMDEAEMLRFLESQKIRYIY